MYFSLTYLSLMQFPTLINWTRPFPFKGLLGAILHFYSNYNRTFCKQTVDTLSWVYTVWLCHTKRTLGLYGLTFMNRPNQIFEILLVNK